MNTNNTLSALPLGLMLLVGSTAAQADNLRSPPVPKIYISECASCHTTYPAGLLVEKNWKKLLVTLGNHFGTDASVSPEELTSISAYLLDNAATDTARYTAQNDPVRLTQTVWFERKHLRKLPASVWADTKVKSAANCQACHTRADQGRFSENDIAVPGFPGRHW